MVGTTLDLLVVAIKRGKQKTPHTRVSTGERIPKNTGLKFPT
jgi:hypothetical protein